MRSRNCVQGFLVHVVLDLVALQALALGIHLGNTRAMLMLHVIGMVLGDRRRSPGEQQAADECGRPLRVAECQPVSVSHFSISLSRQHAADRGLELFQCLRPLARAHGIRRGRTRPCS